MQAIALVGSFARGTARPDSDIDLVLLVDNPQAYRAERAWLSDIPWHTLGVTVTHATDADFGPLWSRFVTFSSGRETEFGFAAPTWAQINPIDAGTFQVIQNGCRLLFDPQHILERLVAAVQYRRRAS